MNKIFNAPPHTRSNIDRRMFPNTENSSSNYNKYNNYNNNNNYKNKNSCNGTTKISGMKVSSSRRGKLQLFREKQDTNSNFDSNTHGRFVDVSRNDAEKQLRTGTRERLLVHLFQRIRQLLG